MKMKWYKAVALIWAGLMLYGAGAAGTYALHEYYWPGATHGIFSSDSAGGVNGSIPIGCFWPIGLPLTVGAIAIQEVMK